MNKKIISRILFIIAVIALVIGASFHGFRMHPEDVTKYNIGVTMGIVMISMFAISLIAGIVLMILAKKKKMPNTMIDEGMSNDRKGRN